jgi:hydrophobic/amphiphilic exporter-1 (mainly G- bacteria), HAE1 family
MSLSDLSIRNPVFAVMVSAAMIVFGYLGYREMGVSQFPEVDFPVVSIVITREAASPDIMDGDVTDVVEDAVASVEGVNYIQSQSLEGTSIVTVYFRLERKIDVAMQDVQNVIAAARRRLPLDIDPPVIAKVNPNNLPVMWLTLSGNVPLHEISDFAEKEFKPLISSIPDVGGVQFAGLQSRNVRIWVDAAKLASFNLTIEEVQQAIQRQHAELPAGTLESRKVERNLRTMGEAYTLEDFGKLIVASRGGQQIELREVAVIENGLEDRRSLARFNRLPAVAVGVRKAIGGNLVRVCENVKARLPELRRALPQDIRVDMPVDYSLFVRENVEELKLTLFLGILLTAGVCFLFLGSLSTTINICMSIPTSLLGTFFVVNYVMRWFGQPPFTINLMTLLGLSLSVGVVVDDAILVLENIYRHRELGKSKLDAASIGAREITFAAMAATFSIMAIFLPVAFMSGIIGRFFFQFGVTVGVAVLLSLLSALTLTPMLCAFFLNVHAAMKKSPLPFGWGLAAFVAISAAAVLALLRLATIWFPDVTPWAWPVLDSFGAIWQGVGLDPFWPEPKVWSKNFADNGPLIVWAVMEGVAEVVLLLPLVRYGHIGYWALNRYVLEPLLLWPTNTFLNFTTKAYTAGLRWSIALWPVVLLVSVALIALSAWMLYENVLGMELVPSEDQSRFVVHVVCPVGSSIGHVDELLQDCENRLVERHDVQSLLTTVATERGQLINEADIFIQLVPHHRRKLRQKEIMQEIRQELEQIRDLRIVIRDLSTEGFTAQRGDPVDFAIQGDWKQLPAKVAEVIDAMADSGKLQDIDTDYRPGMTELRIIPDREKLGLIGVPVSRIADNVSLLVGGQRVAKFTDKGRRYDVRLRLQAQLRTSPEQLDQIMIRIGENQLLLLRDVIDRQYVATLPVINRYNHQRSIRITANPAPNVTQGEAIESSRKLAESLLPANEFTIVELGNAEAMRETINSLVFALVLGIIIAYMILGVQFNSFIHPFTVLLAMPFAVTGALVTLWWTGDTLNMMSMIGLILLMGLVKKNSIILVDYTNQLREEGLSVTEAVLKACPIRLRPILMTSIATVAGAVPAALGLGPGAETRAPMARGIIGGIVLSTLVTLVLVPVFYVLVERMRGVTGVMLKLPEAMDEPKQSAASSIRKA